MRALESYQMLKMLSFDMNARPETSVPLIHCVIIETSSQAMPDFRQTLLQFMDASVHELDKCRKCFHACIYAKEVHFSIYCDSILSTQSIKFIWLILSTIRLNGDIVIPRLRFGHILRHCARWKSTYYY